MEIAGMEKQFTDQDRKSLNRQNYDTAESSSPEIRDQQISQQTRKVSFAESKVNHQSRYKNLPSINAQEQTTFQSKLKPQITKDYVRSQIVGKPDLRILEEEFELGDKFYEL